MLYFAYGSNTNHEQMKRRCPRATFVRNMELPNWRLDFRRVADLTPALGGSVHGALWRVTDECLKSLDRYEGVEKGVYERCTFTIRVVKTNKVLTVATYIMKSPGEITPPSSEYYQRITRGYDDCKLPVSQALTALMRCYGVEEKSFHTYVPSQLRSKRKKRRKKSSTNGATHDSA